MSTTLNTSSTSNSLLTPTLARVDSDEFRSETIGKLAARMTESPREVTMQLLAAHPFRKPVTAADSLIRLMADLINASCTNDVSEAKLSGERVFAASSGLAVSLKWLHNAEDCLDEELTTRIILKALMPLYLAAGQGRSGNSIAESFSLIRASCMIIELNRLTNNNELAAWLKDPVRLANDPFESIPKAFRVQLVRMARVYFNSVSNTSSHSSPNQELSQVELSIEKHRAWWSLAGQLCKQRAQIVVPPHLSVGVIAWEKLLDHWQRVSQSLSGREMNPNSSTILSATDAAPQNSQADSNSTKDSSESSKPKTAGPPPKSKVASDHRFVEIRSSRDPQLSANLDQILHQVRSEQGTLSLIVVKKLGESGASSNGALQDWQSMFIEYMDSHGEATNVKGFICDDGELTLVFQDIDRAELTQSIRDSFERFNSAREDSKLATHAAQPLVAGVAMVNEPSRLFKIDQLIQAAWRCLDGASRQGAGAVKTIEVY